VRSLLYFAAVLTFWSVGLDQPSGRIHWVDREAPKLQRSSYASADVQRWPLGSQNGSQALCLRAPVPSTGAPWMGVDVAVDGELRITCPHPRRGPSMAVPNYQAFMAPDLRITSRTGCLARSYSVTVHPPLGPEIHRRVRDTLPPWRPRRGHESSSGGSNLRPPDLQAYQGTRCLTPRLALLRGNQPRRAP
jgi:hypothetical protein